MIPNIENEYWRALISSFTKRELNAKQTENELKAVYKDDAPAYSTIAK